MKSACLVGLLTLALASCQNAGSNNSTSGPGASTAAAAATSATQISTAPAKSIAAVSPIVDSVLPGDDAAERAHNHKGDGDETGDFSDRTYRHAQGGWFSWDLKVIPNQPNDLVLTYWGSDQRTFDIQIDGEKLVTEQIRNDHPEEFFDKVHPLSAAMIGNKDKVTVKFVSPADGYAGGVFGVKIVRPGASTRPAAKTP
jgi:hypothetical protein